MTRIKDKCVLITGAGSGHRAHHGTTSTRTGARKVVIWDINEERTSRPRSPHTALRNVRPGIASTSPTRSRSPKPMPGPAGVRAVDILINCAGIITGNKTFEQQSVAEIERTMAVNAAAPMLLTREVLPAMIARNEGHVCNIASAAGMISNPRMSVYVASKWAVIRMVRLPAHRTARGPQQRTSRPSHPITSTRACSAAYARGSCRSLDPRKDRPEDHPRHRT